jgi:hypothetical protein
VTTFAWAGLLGLSPEAMITGDGLDFRLRERVVERAFDLRDQMDDSLALKIINRLSEALNS